jgi:hypothetical protein
MGFSIHPPGKFDMADRVFDDAVFEVTALCASDGIKFSDSFDRTWAIQKTLTDGVTFADTPAKTFTKFLSDGVIFADSYDRVWNANRTFQEGIKFSDSYDRVWNAFRTYTDGVEFSETLSGSHLNYQGDWLVDWTKDFLSPRIIGTKDTSASTIWTGAATASPSWTTSTAAIGIWTRAATAKGTWT